MPIVLRLPALAAPALLAAALLAPGCTGVPSDETPPPDRPAPAASAPAPPAAESGPQQRADVIRAHEALMEALRSGDGDALVALLDRAPGLLLYHPRVEAQFDDIDEIRSAFARMTSRLGPAEWTEVHRAVQVHGEVAWHTSRIAIESPNLPEPFLGRATEIWVRRPEGWRLAHAHWSEMPQ